jgi:Sec-independent protein translocase protein TatA
MPWDGTPAFHWGRTDGERTGFWREVIVVCLAVAAIAAGVVVYQDSRLSEVSRDVKESLTVFRRELREDQVELRADVRAHEQRLQKLETKNPTPARAGTVPRTP